MEQLIIPDGYKKTKAGIIPEDWEVDLLDNVLSITTGGRNTQDKIKDGKYPFYVRSQKIERINSYSFDGEGILTAGDGVGTGKVFHYINGKCDIHQRVYLMHNFSKRLHGYYFYIYFKNNFYDKVMSMTAKSSVDSVRREMIAGMPIALPSIKEQIEISNALSDVDALIASIERLIVKKQVIKTATMHQLLTGKKRLPPFDIYQEGARKGQPKGTQQTELGEIPEDWKVLELGEHSFITKLAGFEYSNYFNAYKDGGEIIVVRGTNITHNKLDLSNVKNIPKTTSDMLPRSQLNKGDLVFAYVGTIGPIYYIEESDRFHLGPNTAKITCNKELDTKYVYSYFKSPLIRKEIEDRISIGAQPSLSMTKIRSFELVVPKSINEQRLIAQVLEGFESEIECLKKRLNKTQQVKQGMMQELLTGKTRLI